MPFYQTKGLVYLPCPPLRIQLMHTGPGSVLAAAAARRRSVQFLSFSKNKHPELLFSAHIRDPAEATAPRGCADAAQVVRNRASTAPSLLHSNGFHIYRPGAPPDTTQRASRMGDTLGKLTWHQRDPVHLPPGYTSLQDSCRAVRERSRFCRKWLK